MRPPSTVTPFEVFPLDSPQSASGCGSSPSHSSSRRWRDWKQLKLSQLSLEQQRSRCSAALLVGLSAGGGRGLSVAVAQSFISSSFSPFACVISALVVSSFGVKVVRRRMNFTAVVWRLADQTVRFSLALFFSPFLLFFGSRKSNYLVSQWKLAPTVGAVTENVGGPVFKRSPLTHAWELNWIFFRDF